MREKVSELSVLLDKQGGSRAPGQGTETPTRSCLTLSPELQGICWGWLGSSITSPVTSQTQHLPFPVTTAAPSLSLLKACWGQPV